MEVINIDSSDDDTPLRRPSAAASADSDDSSVSSLDSILDKPSIFNVKKKAAESTAKANRLATSAGSSAGIRRSNDGKANGKAGKSKSTTNTKTKSNNVTDAADGPEKKKPKKPRATPKCQFYNRAFEESRMLSDALLPGDNRLYEYEAASNSSCDTYLGTWKVFMLLDFREFGQATKGKKAGKNCFIHLAEARINRHFGEKCCENMHLQASEICFPRTYLLFV